MSDSLILGLPAAVVVLFLLPSVWSQENGSDADLSEGLAHYDRGEFGPALKKFEAAGGRGVIEARYLAGLMHHRGRGTMVDGRAAIRWYSLAAEANHPAALANLGIIYRDGLGEGSRAVARDAEAAREHLRRAAYLENIPGQLAYAALLLNERRSPEECAEGLAFMRLAAAAGDSTAKENLASLRVTDEERTAAAARHEEIVATIAKLAALRRGGRDATLNDQDESRRKRAGTGAGAPLRLRRVVVRDPMIHDCEALSMLVPAGWDFEGRMEWTLDDSVLVNPVWRIRDPESGLQMGSLPFRSFTWTPDGVLPVGSRHLGMLVLPPITDPAEFVQRFWGSGVLSPLSGRTPERVRELPALAAQAVREWGAPATCRGFVLRYAFEHGGRAVEQDVQFALLYARDGATWLVTHCFTVSAPKGVLDRLAPITSAIYASGDYTSEWRAGWRICYRIFLRRAMAEIVAARKLGAALNEHREEMAKIAADLERDRAASTEARHRALSEALGGIETWSDPWQGRTVELPQGYREAWVNRHGEVLLSETPGFDPNASNSRVEGDWRPSRRIDPMGGRR